LTRKGLPCDVTAAGLGLLPRDIFWTAVLRAVSGSQKYIPINMLRSASVNSASYFSDNGTAAPSTANSTARHSASQDIKPSKAYEAAKLIALRTLKALSKTSVSAVQLDEVPKELLFGERVDLHRWTMILTDNNLKELSEQQSSGKLYYLDGSAAKVMNMFDSFYRPMKLKSGLLELNIANAKDITNYGIAMIVRNNPGMLALNVSGCSNVTDIALREIGICCPRIECLNVSSCQEIDGSGLGAIAESCHSLLKLDISRCRKVENWSMKKVFYECKLLEEVNVSHMAKVGDEEIRVLAQNCPNLIALHAAESPYISDTSIQVIAECCPDLDLLDVSRSEMQYRISDVSLLAVGQRSRSLRTLRCSGCDTITDVGLNWLTEGCKALEELDFTSCTKVIRVLLLLVIRPVMLTICVMCCTFPAHGCRYAFDWEQLPRAAADQHLARAHADRRGHRLSHQRLSCAAPRQFARGKPLPWQLKSAPSRLLCL
jgi:hypothetical protein